MSRRSLIAFVLVAVGLVASPTPAHADYSVLCQGYSSCASKGYSHAGYPNNDHKMYWRMYTGVNCTNYVAYRLVTTNGMPNTRPHSGIGNARDWGKAVPHLTNSTPAVGSVAWWGINANHVAYVERVVSPTEIWISESNWGSEFSWRKITKSGKGWPDGFIHFADPQQDMQSVDAPVIDRVPRSGRMVAVTNGTWTPTPRALRFSYQWLLDGQPIAGATDRIFTPTEAMNERDLSVRVTVSQDGFKSKTVETAPAGIESAVLTPLTPAAIEGDPKVGQPLLAHPGVWAPEPATITYQWFANGKVVPGATSETFTPTADQVGKQIMVRVSAQHPDYTGGWVESAATARVIP